MRTELQTIAGPAEALIERVLLGHRGAALYYDCRAGA
jgi:hypothetical protein